jgi:hypothetical protein
VKSSWDEDRQPGHWVVTDVAGYTSRSNIDSRRLNQRVRSRDGNPSASNGIAARACPNRRVQRGVPERQTAKESDHRQTIDWSRAGQEFSCDHFTDAEFVDSAQRPPTRASGRVASKKTSIAA